MSNTTAPALLNTLRSRGVVLEVDGDQLRYEAPSGALDAAMLADVRAHKAELLALLSTSAPGGLPPLLQKFPGADFQDGRWCWRYWQIGSRSFHCPHQDSNQHQPIV